MKTLADKLRELELHQLALVEFLTRAAVFRTRQPRRKRRG